MRDYTQMLNTVKAIQDKFGSAEFTRKDYQREIDSKRNHYREDRIYGHGTALDLDNGMVKKVREEDFIFKDDDGKKHVGVRYFYEVDDNFLENLRKMLQKDVRSCEVQIARAENEIAKIQERINYKKSLLQMFNELMESVSEEA